MPTRDEIARALFAADEGVTEQDANAAGDPYIATHFEATTHRGDCTNEAFTCSVCLADTYRKMADAILALKWNEPGLRRATEIVRGLMPAPSPPGYVGQDAAIKKAIAALEAEIKEPDDGR